MSTPESQKQHSIGTFLRSLPLFEGIPYRSGAFRSFLSGVRLETYKKSKIIYQPGTRPSHFYLVHDGEVQVLKRGVNENRLVLIAGVGDVFGEVSFLSEEEHTTLAIATLDSVLYRIDGKAFLKLLAEEPSVGHAFTLLLSRRIRNNLISVKNLPSEVNGIVFPQRPELGRLITSLLAEEMIRLHAERPIILSLTNSPIPDGAIPFHNLIERMDEDDIIDIRLNFKKRAPIIHANLKGLSKARIGRALPGFLGLLKKHFRMILIDGSELADHPILIRMISQCDHVILTRLFPLTLQDNLWKAAAVQYRGVMNDFSHKLITLSYEPHSTVRPRDSFQQAVEARSFLGCARPELHINHFRLKRTRTGDEMTPDQQMRSGIGRLARRLAGITRGLCLGGGGARSLAHLGVVDVFEQQGIEYDAICGTSMGAIIGAGYAMGLKTKEVRYFIRKFIPSASAILDKNFPLISFFRGDRIAAIIRHVFWDVHFEDLEIPFFCNSSDLNTGQMIVFDRARLTTALRASISLPGIFPPFRMRHFSLVDGGVLNNLPGDIMRKRGFHRVIGVNVTPRIDRRASSTLIESERGYVRGLFEYFTLPPILKIVTRSINLQGRALLNLRMNDFDHVIHPDVSSYEIFDFNRLDEIIERGRAATEQEIKRVQMVLHPRGAGSKRKKRELPSRTTIEKVK
jgi:NTE family protein